MGGDFFNEMTFAELVGGRENVIGGPFGSSLTSKDYVSSGVPIVRGSNMSQAGRYLGGEFAFISSQKALTLAANQVEGGCLVVTQRGTLGQVSLVPLNGFPKYVVSQSQMGVRVEGADPLFVYYLLTSSLFSSFLRGAAIQTGVPHINLGILRDWRVRVPAPHYQREISALLGALDDKIELNQRIIETLEETSRTLFKNWFIDFAPIRARAEGNATGLADDLNSLFPSRLDADGLPEGWTLQPLSAIGRFLNGLALQKYAAEPNGPSLPVVKIAELRTGPTLRSNRAAIDIPAEYVVQDGDHLFSWSGSLTHVRWAHGPGALNQHLFKVTPRGVPAWLTFQAVEHHLSEFQAIAAAKAVTMGHIQRHHLDQAYIAVPNQDLLNAIDQIMSPLYEKTLNLALQSRALTSLRDALLPRLISGQVRISDVEQAAAVA